MVIMKRSKVANPTGKSGKKTETQALSEDEDLLDSDVSEEMISQEMEPVPKKIKKDVTQEAEKEMKIYDGIIKDGDVKISAKLSKLTVYLQFIFEKNVNTLEFETNFNDWIKSTLSTLLDESRVASVELYKYLCNVLKVAPTIIEASCEKILTFIYNNHQFNSECNNEFEIFMEGLSYTFEKLRRYPKLIAKLLCSVRDNLIKCSGHEGAKKFMKKMLGHKAKDHELFVLPKRFMESYISIVSMLPQGQIMDLWKTLQHNLDEECIKKYNSSEVTSKLFLKVVVELMTAFLLSIKVCDYSVPLSTVEKVVDMMGKLKEGSIPELIDLVPDEYDASYTSSLLKLCNTWAYFNHFMWTYNNAYKSPLSREVDTFQQAVDLSLFFPQLPTNGWGTLWSDINRNKDSTSASFLVSLVALKMKHFSALEQQRKNDELLDSAMKKSPDDIKMEEETRASDDFLQRNLQESAKFLWNNQHSLQIAQQNYVFSGSCEDTLRIAASFLQQDELIEYAKTYLDNNLSLTSQIDMKNFKQQLSSNMAFRVAVVLESLSEGLRKIGKSISMKNPIKKFLADFLNPLYKFKLLNGLTLKNNKVNDDELKKSMMDALKIVNQVLELDVAHQDSEDQISATLLQGIISLIGHEELTQYPKNVKNTIFLSVLLMFIPLVKDTTSQEILDDLSGVLSECGQHSQGNDVLFHVKWPEFYTLVKTNVAHLSEKSAKSLSALTLENVYVSPKVANDFGKFFISSVSEEDFDLNSPDGYLNICILEYILQEQIGTKSKSNTVLISHVKDLSKMFVKKLSDGCIITDLHSILQSLKKGKKKNISSARKSKHSDVSVSAVMKACHLLLKGKSHMEQQDLSDFTLIVLPYLQFSLEYLEESVGEVAATTLYDCVQFIREAVKSFEEYREKLPQDFLLRVWNSCASYESNVGGDCDSISDPALMKTILDVADESESQLICDSMIERVDNGTELALTAQMLNCLVNSETTDDKKKQIRRSTVELGIFKYLKHINTWKEADNFVQVAVPYIQFQTSLLKRRKPMSNLSTLAVCMSSITSVPLERIDSVESFKTVFSQICDLLNACNVHRLDVLSFRSHVFLQCFQFLVESLIKKADQNNKLSDTEIFDLRHCAHCIERICQSAKLGREELGRIAPYMIVIFMRQFEKITVYPVVKNPLLNGCYKVLDMCTEQGISHVNSMLSVGSREIFKAVYELYKKFYRYKGKV